MYCVDGLAKFYLGFLPSGQLPKKFTLLIDESGDQGLDRVMTHASPFGASSYLTMGAALVPTSQLPAFRGILETIRAKLQVQALHCTDMSHAQVSYAVKEIAKLRMLTFGVISKKSTLGSYQETLKGEHQAQDYYNKCSQYLFELVASYASSKNFDASSVDIIFEEKRGHDYSRMGRYLTAIAKTPIDKRAAKLEHLTPFQIGHRTKMDEPALSIADVVAYALHKGFCSENNKLNLTEQRYLRELKSKFYSCPNSGQIANFGIKFIKGPVGMGLQDAERNFAMKFYAKNPV